MAHAVRMPHLWKTPRPASAQPARRTLPICTATAAYLSCAHVTRVCVPSGEQLDAIGAISLDEFASCLSIALAPLALCGARASAARLVISFE